MKQKYPTGIDSFEEIASFYEDSKQRQYYFVDKTQYIIEFLNLNKVTAVFRPRRFGKTLFLSMLKSFFTNENREQNRRLFEGLAISSDKELCDRYHGKYPVIFLTLKSFRAGTFNSAMEKFSLRISALYSQFTYLMLSKKLDDFEKEKFTTYREQKANHEELRHALHFLSKCLHKHHKQRVIILLDECDSPIHDAYATVIPFHEEMLDFMSAFVSATFKGNAALERGMITGILYISLSNMFSGANNIRNYGVLEEEFSGCCGFSEEEIKTQLIQDSNVNIDFSDIKRWYNGYNFGATTSDIYNPWSIICCLSSGGKIENYWVASGDSKLIGHALIRSRLETMNDFKILLSGGEVEREIDKRTFFVDIGSDPVALWTLLLYAGYLKVIEQKTIYPRSFKMLAFLAQWDQTIGYEKNTPNPRRKSLS